MEVRPVGKTTERFYGNVDVPEGGYVGNADGSPLTRFDLVNGILQQTGILRFMNSASGLIFGSMYTNDVPVAFTMTDQDTWYEAADPSNPWTSGLVNRCTFTDPGITVVEPGRYVVIWGMSTDFSSSPGAIQQIEYGIMIDGAIQLPGQSHRSLANSTDTGHSSGFALLDVAADEVVSLAAMNETSAGKTLHVEHGNMVIIHIGGP